MHIHFAYHLRRIILLFISLFILLINYNVNGVPRATRKIIYEIAYANINKNIIYGMILEKFYTEEEE